MKNVFIIPARSGSKGIPNKNLKLINGIPMFVWSIIHAKYISEKDDVVLVSSDSDKYLNIAKRWGAVPIKRPKELASDKAFTEPVMTHAVSKIDMDLEDNIILLQPTSPLRSKRLMNKLKEELQRTDSAISLTESYEFNWVLIDDVHVKPTYTKRPRRQDMKPQLVENGSIYFTKYKHYKEFENRVHKRAKPLIVNFYESIEIDTLEELNLIQKISKEFNSEWLQNIINKKRITNLFLDIDGVFAKNQKTTNKNTRFYSTQDSNALNLLLKKGINIVLISSEQKPHSTELFKKIGIKEVNFNIKNKYEFVRMYMKKNKIFNKQSIFVGNDIQDKKCLEYFQLSLVPKDCNESIKQYAKFILSKNGGDGALTELVNLMFS